MARFDECIPLILAFEGGFVDNIADRGGATNMGITQNTYDAWRHGKGLPVQPVRFMMQDEASQIYHELYWVVAHCDHLPVPVDLCVFDMAVNSGVVRSAKMLQESIGATADGLIGPLTLAAVGQHDPLAVATQYLDQREAFYHMVINNNPSQHVFLEGWLRRVDQLRHLCGIPGY